MLFFVNLSIFLRHAMAAALSGDPDTNLDIRPSRAFLISSLDIPLSSWRYWAEITYPTGTIEIMNPDGDASLMDRRSYIFLTFDDAVSTFGWDAVGAASSRLDTTSS